MNTVRVSDLPPELVERLSPAEKARLATEILGVYLRTRWAILRSKDFTDTVTALRAGAPEEEVTAWSLATHWRAARLGWAVRRTLRLVPTDSRCLMQSLVLTTLLARRGIGSSLIIGVRPGDTFEAHAWVEYCERPLLPASQGVFERLTQV